MRLVVGLYRIALGGTESYTLTTVEALERLGHTVTVYAEDVEPKLRDDRWERVEVACDAGELPEACDGVLVQDAVTAHVLAARHPGAPRLFVAHADEMAVQVPPGPSASCTAPSR